MYIQLCTIDCNGVRIYTYIPYRHDYQCGGTLTASVFRRGTLLAFGSPCRPLCSDLGFCVRLHVSGASLQIRSPKLVHTARQQVVQTETRSYNPTHGRSGTANPKTEIAITDNHTSETRAETKTDHRNRNSNADQKEVFETCATIVSAALNRFLRVQTRINMK